MQHSGSTNGCTTDRKTTTPGWYGGDGQTVCRPQILQRTIQTENLFDGQKDDGDSTVLRQLFRILFSP